MKLELLIFTTATLCALLGVVLAGSEPVSIKIVDSPALSRFPAMPSHHNKQLTLRAKPSPVSGPPHLQLLSGKCFTAKDNGYTYSICLFQNITQDEDRIGWNSFNGVLGVWHEWIIENDTFVGMHYTLGDPCIGSDREVKMMFNCSASTKVHNFTEPNTCSYHMVLNTPLACFKGAMQVYHVLSSEQLKEWDGLDHRYHSDEITYKGLTNKRRKLLVKAGLLQEAKKEEITTAPPVTVPPSSSSPMVDLAQCLREKEKYKNKLQEMKTKVLKVVEDSPEIHQKLDLILSSESSLDPGESQSHDQNMVPSDGNGDENSLLSDEVMDTLARDFRNEHIDVINHESIVAHPDGKDYDEHVLDTLLEDLDVNDL